MKTIKLLVIGLLFLFANATKAQVSVNLSIGTPPPWGPVGYSEVRYYYVPDVESYYDVRESRFIYLDGGVWVHRASLPVRYRSYDLYSGYKVVMTDYRGDTPYKNYGEYRSRYAKGYRGGEQRTIAARPGRGDSGERTISKSRTSEKINRNEMKSEGHGNGHEQGKGRGQDNDKGNNGKNGEGHREGNGNKK
jgi:hypothetical protein